MGLKTLKKIDYFIGSYAVVLCVGAISIFGSHIFWGVLIGSIVSLVNWIVLRWIGVRLVLAANKQRFAIFLGFKSVLTLGLILAILSASIVEPIAFLIGLSTLVLGVLSKGAVDAIAEGDKILREER